MNHNPIKGQSWSYRKLEPIYLQIGVMRYEVHVNIL